MYGFSLFVCLLDGMAHENSAATGTVMRLDTLKGLCRGSRLCRRRRPAHRERSVAVLQPSLEVTIPIVCPAGPRMSGHPSIRGRDPSTSSGFLRLGSCTDDDDELEGSR